jgi:hypothetical protein
MISRCFHQAEICVKQCEAFAKKHQTDIDHHLVERASYSSNLGPALV